MIRIKFIANCCSDEIILGYITKFFDWDNVEDYKKKYCFTTDNDYTHIIFVNCLYKTKIDKENVIGISWEPLEFMSTSWLNEINNIKNYYIGNSSSFSNKNILESYSYMLPYIPYKDVNNFIDFYPKKVKLMNFVYSKNNHNPNMLYSYRHLIGRTILESKLNIDIHGNSTKKLKRIFRNNKNIKNNFKWDDISHIYKDYKFSIVIENSRHPAYFSEKIIVPLLCGCIPLYLGCTKIDDYFSDYVIHLTGKIEEDIKIIKNVLKNPDYYYKKIDIEKIKDLVHIKNLIKKEFLMK